MDFKQIIEELFNWLPYLDEYKIKIKPILISRDSEGEIDDESLLNRFVYTIVDQQRDVENTVIPLWNALLYYGINYNFVKHSKFASQYISTILQAYGHQQYHTKEERTLMHQSLGSRTDGILEAYRNRSPSEFLEIIIKKQKDLLGLFEILKEYYFISDKSASFFLRDVEGFDFSLVPIDSNVARSLQMSGLFFIQLDKNPIEFRNITKDIIPIKKRTNEKNFRALSDKIFELSEKFGKSPYKLNRYLFLLGADFCQSKNCGNCRIGNLCFYNNLNNIEKNEFLRHLNS
ncbi:MAG: hypothetical protein GF329_13720 [Candidatus Lokiarchaeota archaeon]|nr:hypothetical protein [Candidatus Lokiarchaeota archaeon]